jgi:hypothetical protein
MERYKNVDQKVQAFMSGIHRKMNRRNFVYKLAMGITATIATMLIKPIGGLETALAHGTACYPPHGQFCSGCTTSGGCPSGYVTCTSSNVYSDCKHLCPYSSGFWYSEGSNKGHICRDCKTTLYGPVGYPWYSECAKGAQISGKLTLCGCRGGTHY